MLTRRCFPVLLLAAGLLILRCAVMKGADLYVAPNGTASGNGTAAKPYDLSTALSGSVAQPGDSFWLREGTYQIGKLYTEIGGAAGRPITFRQTPGERAQLVGSLTIGGLQGYVIFRDFELCSGVEQRTSKQTGVGFTPTDLPNFVEGIQIYTPNISCINLVVHDSVRSGIYTSKEATNVLIYGCLVYNVGWASPDNAEGHSYYLQGAGEIGENIACNSAGAGFHVYASAAGDVLENLTLTGNVAWGAGTLQNVRLTRDWLVGVDYPAVRADHITLTQNMSYLTTNATTLSEVQLGREGTNGSLGVISNYWPQGLVINNWSNAVVTHNTIAPRKPEDTIALEQKLTNLEANWNSNYYAAQNFRVKSKSYDFAQWTNATGYDSASSCSPGVLHGTRVFVRPNRYDPGRANIIVYNWDNLSQVSVDLRNVLALGTAYEIRNAEDFFSPSVLKGTFDGKPVTLPMNGLSVAKPMTDLRTPQATGPLFNVFILLSNIKRSH